MEMQNGQPVPTAKSSLRLYRRDQYAHYYHSGGPEQYRPDHQRALRAAGCSSCAEDAESYLVPEPRQLGENSSFAVFKKVETDVVGFEEVLRVEQRQDRSRTVGSKDVRAMAQRRPTLALSPDTDSPAGGISPEQLNNFEYVNADGSGDPRGIRCPVGAHIRRVNPRGQPVQGQGVPGGSNNSHRLVRRGMPYGPIYDRTKPYDGLERGMLFHFVNSNIENQNEYLLRRWVNDSEFAGAVRLHPKSKDPLIGAQNSAESIFVIPQANGGPPVEVTGLSQLRYDQSCRLPHPAEQHCNQIYRHLGRRPVICFAVVHIHAVRDPPV